MKKIKMSIVLVMLLVPFLAGCDRDRIDRINEYPEPGTWITDDMFVNEWLGVQFQLPAGWDFLSDSELEEIFEEIIEESLTALGEENSVLSEIRIRAIKGNVVYDMLAINLLTSSSVQINFTRIPLQAINYGVEMLMEEATRNIPLGYTYTIRTDTVFIGDVEFYVIDVISNFMGATWYRTTHINQSGRNLRYITIESMNQSEIEYIWGYFNEIGTERIESAVP